MNQCKCNDNQDKLDEKFSNKEIFKIALDARNFEIKMFWQRCNYFLLLNTSVGAAVAAVVVSESLSNIMIPFLCFIGACVCLAWVNVGLGAKFWQVYWEQVVVEFQDNVGLTSSPLSEEKPHSEKDIFSHNRNADHIERRVKVNLDIEKSSNKDESYNRCDSTKSSVSIWVSIWVSIKACFSFSDESYNRHVLTKPSVTRWMHKTACFFFVVWVLVGAMSIYAVSTPIGIVLIFAIGVAVGCLISPQLSQKSSTE